MRRFATGSFWPGGNATDTAKASRGGEAIIAAEPATFCAASAMSGLTLTCVAADVVAVENMAAAPVFEPVKYPPKAPIAGINTINTEPIEAAVVASWAAMPLADITVPSSMNNNVIAATDHHRCSVARTIPGTSKSCRRYAINVETTAIISHTAGLAATEGNPLSPTS